MRASCTIQFYRKHGKLIAEVEDVRVYRRNGDLAATAGVPGFPGRRQRQAKRVRKAVVQAVGKLKLRKVRGALR